MHILVINGPNLNLLGLREPDIYGKGTYEALCRELNAHARELDITIECFQSNHEGDLIDRIQASYGKADGIIINPAAYTHTSIALLDALKAVQIPTVEVHLSDVSAREEFRQISYVGLYAEKRIMGLGFAGYTQAMDYLLETYG